MIDKPRYFIGVEGPNAVHAFPDVLERNQWFSCAGDRDAFLSEVTRKTAKLKGPLLLIRMAEGPMRVRGLFSTAHLRAKDGTRVKYPVAHGFEVPVSHASEFWADAAASGRLDEIFIRAAGYVPPEGVVLVAVDVYELKPDHYAYQWKMRNIQFEEAV